MEMEESEVLTYLEVEEDMLEQTDRSIPEHYQQVPNLPYLASICMFEALFAHFVPSVIVVAC